jgi:hypothetical protein
MRGFGSVFGVLVSVGVLVVAARLLGLDDLVRESILAGRLLDWLMGTLAFLWLLAVLKAPWDLYFQAHTAAFEQRRSRERGIRVDPERVRFVQTARTRLLWLALGIHALSAAVTATVTFFTGGTVGYWFAGFYVLSTLFRPLAAGYVYLASRLGQAEEESRFPREDTVALRQRVESLEERATALADDAAALHLENDTLRAQMDEVAREFGATISKLTDQKEIIDGIQALARLLRTAA